MLKKVSFPKQMLIAVILATLFAVPGFCQETDVVPSDLNVPPLERLIGAALEHSPLLDQQLAMVRMREWQVKSARYDWARYLLFFSELRYGSVDIMITNGGQVAYGDKESSTRYNVGTRLQLSIFDFIDLKQKRKIAGELVKSEEGKLEELKRMIRDDVIRLWNNVISYKKLVAIGEDQVAVQESNFYYAEQQFKAGDIALLEYARIKEIKAKAEQDYQLNIKELREAYYLLESLVGVKLEDLNKTGL
jgi:outer membrane protein TolC